MGKVGMRVSYGEMSEMLCWISIPPSPKTNQSVSLFFTHRGALVSPEKTPPSSPTQRPRHQQQPLEKMPKKMKIYAIFSSRLL